MTWKINFLQYTNDTDKGVIKANWICIASDEDISFNEGGVSVFTPDPSSPDYIAYEDITEEMALGWVWNVVDKSSIETELQNKIDEAKNPTTQKGKPWPTETTE